MHINWITSFSRAWEEYLIYIFLYKSFNNHRAQQAQYANSNDMLTQGLILNHQTEISPTILGKEISNEWRRHNHRSLRNPLLSHACQPPTEWLTPPSVHLWGSSSSCWRGLLCWHWQYASTSDFIGICSVAKCFLGLDVHSDISNLELIMPQTVSGWKHRQVSPFGSFYYWITRISGLPLLLGLESSHPSVLV